MTFSVVIILTELTFKLLSQPNISVYYIINVFICRREKFTLFIGEETWGGKLCQPHSIDSGLSCGN